MPGCGEVPEVAEERTPVPRRRESVGRDPRLRTRRLVPGQVRVPFTAEDSIYLGPGATGKGIGTALLGELIARAKAAGLKELVAVIADQGAEASIAIHERYGFTLVGRMGRVGYKFGHWVGTVMLQKSLK